VKSERIKLKTARVVYGDLAKIRPILRKSAPSVGDGLQTRGLNRVGGVYRSAPIEGQSISGKG
jgi:hypothetical protein